MSAKFSGICFCFLLAVHIAGAQHFSVEHWSSQSHLLSSGVRSISESQDGSLWIGTETGLVSFDGLHFRPLQPRGSQIAKYARVDYVTSGQDGTTYVGTDDRFFVSGRRTLKTFATKAGNKNLRVLVVLPVGEDEAWIGSQSGYLFHYRHSAMEQVGAGAIPNDTIYGLAKTHDGTVWLATGMGLFSLREGRIAPYRPGKPLPVQRFYDLAVSPDGTIYAATEQGLFGIRGSKWTRWTKRDRLPSGEINVLTIDKQGALWIGTAGGLARLEGRTIRPMRSVQCSVGALFVDTQENVWAGCENYAGLYRLKSTPARFLKPSRPAGFLPTTLAGGSNGAVWIGSADGLYEYAGGLFTKYTKQQGLPSNWISNVSATPNGIIWVATDSGLAKIDKGRIATLRNAEQDIGYRVYSAEESGDGALWVWTEKGFFRRTLDHSAFSLIPEFTNLLTAQFVDRSGALWVGTHSEGLYRFQGKSKFSYKKADGLGSNSIYSVAQDDAGVIWVWTAGGLSRIRDGRCVNISYSAGLPQGEPGSIAFDGAGRIWLRTQAGIAAIDLNEANSVIANSQPFRRTRFFGSEEGFGSVLSNPENLTLLVNRASGQVFIPSADSILVLDTSATPTRITDVSPRVISAFSDAGEHDPAAPIKLPPGDLHLQFAYKVPALFDSDNRLYRYRLSGFDKIWRLAKEQREATYTSLPPGTYRFEVSSRTPFGQWISGANPVELTVLPHFYQTGWWYTALAIIAGLLVWFGYQVRLLGIRKQHAAVMAERDSERTRLAEELHDTLSRGLMTIHMQLQLARASLPGKPEGALTHIGHAVDLVRQSASETRNSIAALHSDNAQAITLRAQLERAATSLTLTSGMPVDIHIDLELPVIPVEMQHDILRIAEEALSNVSRHSGAQRASLSAGAEGERFFLKIEDDGCGFNPESLSMSNFGHFGINGMRERAKRIRGTLATECTPGKGAKVVFEVCIREFKRRRRDK